MFALTFDFDLFVSKLLFLCEEIVNGLQKQNSFPGFHASS